MKVNEVSDLKIHLENHKSIKSIDKKLYLKEKIIAVTKANDELPISKFKKILKRCLADIGVNQGDIDFIDNCSTKIEIKRFITYKLRRHYPQLKNVHFTLVTNENIELRLLKEKLLKISQKKITDNEINHLIICESIENILKKIECSEDYECLFENYTIDTVTEKRTHNKKKKRKHVYNNYYAGSENSIFTISTPMGT